MDSCCSFYRRPKKTSENGLVWIGDIARLWGIGSIKIRLFIGSEKVLNEVRYVPRSLHWKEDQDVEN